MQAAASLLDGLPTAPHDPIFRLAVACKADADPRKIDLGVGAYRDDEGKPWVLPVVRKVEQRIANGPVDHEYLPIAGLASFTSAAAKLILGANSPAIHENKTATVQTVSGTGALNIGAHFLKHCYRPDAICLLSDPTWSNHVGIFNRAGIKTQTYKYWNPRTVGFDVEGMLDSLNRAPEGSIIVLHPCAHNPTGIDPTPEDWECIADVIQQRRLFPFFDCAYQGFASGDVDRDAGSIRYFIERGFEMLIAQSFAKNLGLYGERCGALTVVARTPDLRDAAFSQLCVCTRTSISNPPAYGARIASMVLNDADLYSEWIQDMQTMASRITAMRRRLHAELNRLGTPGNWDHIINQIGMFSFTGLTARQVQVLREKYHVYMTENGRISMAGLNSSNVEYFAKAVDDVVRTEGTAETKP